MNYQFCSLVDPGRVRSNNEDAVVVMPARGLALLADGMGGYKAGEVASGMATALLGAELGRWVDEASRSEQAGDIRQAIERCVHKVNRSVFTAARTYPEYSGMGTTLVVGVFQADRLVLGHIGDSRAYRLRAGELTQITRDHSLLQEQVDAGMITPQQAAVSIHRNLVTRALGVENAVRVEIHEHPVEPGDCYLLCSDGLSDMLDDTQIATILRRRGSMAARAQALVDEANSNGGRDNIAVVLVQARALASGEGWLSRLLRKQGVAA